MKDIAPPDLAALRALYDRGLYLTAYQQGVEALGPIHEWRGTAARVLAGRLAHHLGAPKFGRWLFLQAYRRDRTHPEALHSYARTLLERKGPLATLRFLRSVGDDLPGSAEPEERAEWLALHALALAHLRDFDAADSFLERAERTCPGSDWVAVERAEVREQEDRYEESLAEAMAVLARRPDYRPAVQGAAHLLSLLGRDGEALEMLAGAAGRMESWILCAQLAMQLSEEERHAEAERWMARCEELMPLRHLDRPKPKDEDEGAADDANDEDDDAEFLAGFRSDVAYHLGDHARAVALARQSKSGFFTRVAERMEKAAPGAKRVRLPVGFVRQHHFTCAPATLTTLSRYWSRPAEHLSVVEEICYDGTPQHSERQWAEDNGWATREFTVTWEAAVALLDRGVPFTLSTTGVGMGHLQAVIGYDERRGTLLIRDPYHRHVGEALMPELLEREKAYGPRGLALVPRGEERRYEGLDLPDAALHDLSHALQAALKVHRRDEAQRQYEALERDAPEHRLTLFARRSLAAYDDDRTGHLAAVEALLARFPGEPNLTMARLALLRDLSRRDELESVLAKLAEPAFLKKRDKAEEAGTAPDPAEAPTPAAGLAGSPADDAEVERWDPVYWGQYAQELLSDARRHDKARLLLRRLLSLRPTDAPSLFSLARIHWARREFDEALELYRVAACIEDKDEAFAWGYFRAARQRGRAEEALALLRARYARSGTRSGLPARTLHLALNDLDRTHEGFTVLEEAIRRRPDDGELLTFAAEAHARLGRFDGAAELLRRAAGRVSRADLLAAEAQLLQRRGEPAEALARWRQVLEMEPLSMAAHAAVADLLAGAEGAAAVNAHFEAAAARFPHHFRLHQAWAEFLGSHPGGDAPADGGPPLRLRVLDRLVAINPNDAWARRERAVALDAAGRTAEAFEEARVAYTLDPNESSVHGIGGAVCVSAQRWADARTAFQNAVRLDADNDYAVSQLVALCDSPAQRREVLAFVAAEIVRQPVEGSAISSYAAAAVATLSPDELLASLQRIQGARPDLWQAWSSLVRQCVGCDRPEDALSLARQAVERFPLVPPVYLDLARVHQMRGEHEAEQDALRRALEIAPNWGPAVRALANALERAGRGDEGLELLRGAARREPLKAEHQWALALGLWQRHQRTEAVGALKTYLRLEPRTEGAWEMLADWTRQGGDAGEAAEMARENVRRSPGDAGARLALARVLPDGPEHLEERLAALGECLRLEPRNFDACDLKATLLAEAGRYDEALAACRPATVGGGQGGRVPTELRGRAAWVEAARGDLNAAVGRMADVVRSDPGYLWGWRMLAQWYDNMGEANGAPARYAEAARKLTELRPQDGSSWGLLGDALLRTGDRDGAKSAFARAVQQDPDYAFAAYSFVSLSLDDGEAGAAVTTLERIRGRVHEPWVHALGVRIAAKREDANIAREHLERLAAWPPGDGVGQDGLRSALLGSAQTMHHKGWGAVAADALWSALTASGAHPPRAEAGEAWATVACEYMGDLLGCEARLPQLWQRGADAAAHAGAVYLEALAGTGRAEEVRKFVRANREYLRSHPRTWGAAACALYTVGDASETLQWTDDWKARGDGATPWGLLFRSLALREQDRPAEASAVCEDALGLTPPPGDDTQERHALLRALDLALIGKTDEASKLWPRSGDPDEDSPYFGFFRGLLVTLLRLRKSLAAPGADRGRAFAAAKEDLGRTRATFPEAKNSPLLCSLYRRTVKQVAEAVGGPAAAIWAATSGRP